MHPFTNRSLAEERSRRLLHEAEQFRLAAAVPRPRRRRQVWVTVVVAVPYEHALVGLPARACAGDFGLALEPALLATPRSEHEPDSVRVRATWRRGSRQVRAADVEVRAAGPTWSHLTVHLLAPRHWWPARVETAAWALARAMREDIEGRSARYDVPFSALVASPTVGRQLVASASAAR